MPIRMRVALDSSHKTQQATNDVSQTGTEELVEDDLQVGGFSGYWSEVRAGTSMCLYLLFGFTLARANARMLTPPSPKTRLI